MKDTEMLLALNMIEDKYIEEAAPRKRSIRRRIAMIAVAAIFVSLTAFLFFPYDTRPPSVREYKDSEYYEIIRKFNEYTFEEPIYANNFDYFLSTYLLSKRETPQGTMTDSMGSPSSDFSDPAEYSEDLSAEVIKDGDIYVANEKNIFISENIYSINGEDSKKIYYYHVHSRFSSLFPSSASAPEMFMSDDGSTMVCVFSTTVSDPEVYRSKQRYTEIIAYDVRDPKNVTEKNRVTISGELLRCISANGKLIVISSYTPKVSAIDYSDPLTFIPQIAEGWNEFAPLPASALIAPEKLTSACYTTFLMLDEDDLSITDCRSHISESADVYVSGTSVYTTRTITAERKSGDYTEITPYTVLTRMSYSENGFSLVGAATLKGQVTSHNFLCERDGILYAVTKTSLVERHDKLPIYACCMCMHEEKLVSSNANIYKINAQTMELVEHRDDLCQSRRTLSSVLYSGNYAHLTFSDNGKTERISADLSSFKLSVGGNEQTESMLLDLWNSHFLTLTQSAEGAKVSILRMTPDGLEEVTSYIIKGAITSGRYNYKDEVFIDRENRLIGFAIKRKQYEGEDPDDYDADGMPVFSEYRYVLLRFNGESLERIAEFPFRNKEWKNRAILREGYLYVFSPSEIKAVPIN